MIILIDALYAFGGLSLILLLVELLLLLCLIDHCLLDALYYSLITVFDHLVDAHVGGRAFSSEARLDDCRPISRKQYASFPTSLADLDQLRLHEYALLNRGTFLVGAHDVSR